MSGGSRSSSSTTTVTSNNQRQASMDASRNQGTAITAGGNVYAVDGGAFDTVTAISEHNTWLRDRENERAAQVAINQSNNITGLANAYNNNLSGLLSGAQNNLAGVARESNTALANLTAGAQNNLAGVALEAFDYVGDAFDQSLAALSEDRTAQYEQQAQVLAGVASASRSETASALDTITKYFFGAIALVGGIYALGQLK